MDSDYQAAKAWLLNVQQKLYQWSRKHPNEPYRDLWNWVTDSRNLRCAWKTIATNKGKRTPGIDGVTVGSIRYAEGETCFLEGLRQELKAGQYKPSPVRRKWIPKRSKPGEFRPLGIPTVKDRVVQCAVKQVLEAIFEARFWHVSYGFRPGRGCHGALEHIRMSIRPRAKDEDGKRRKTPYQWVIEGDIKGCFDNIDHHQLMERVRKAVADRHVNRLLVHLLKSGVLENDRFIDLSAGTPQGGVISPLLANIALSAIEEKYERWVNHQTKLRASRKHDGIAAASGARSTDRRRGLPVFFPIRYADDFVVLVSGSRSDAINEKESLGKYLYEGLGLELSVEKTRVTPLVEGFEFLGQRVRLRWDPRFGYTPRLEIPKHKSTDLRYQIKQLTKRRRSKVSLQDQIRTLNPMLRGWGNYFRYCTNAKDVFRRLDWYTTDRIWRWMRKKYPKANAHWIARHRCTSVGGKRRNWRTGRQELFLTASLPVKRYKRGWMGKPDYATSLGEPDA